MAISSASTADAKARQATPRVTSTPAKVRSGWFMGRFYPIRSPRANEGRTLAGDMIKANPN
jgi:hypothetical protein